MRTTKFDLGAWIFQKGLSKGERTFRLIFGTFLFSLTLASLLIGGSYILKLILGTEWTCSFLCTIGFLIFIAVLWAVIIFVVDYKFLMSYIKEGFGTGRQQKKSNIELENEARIIEFKNMIERDLIDKPLILKYIPKLKYFRGVEVIVELTFDSKESAAAYINGMLKAMQNGNSIMAVVEGHILQHLNNYGPLDISGALEKIHIKQVVINEGEDIKETPDD